MENNYDSYNGKRYGEWTVVRFVRVEKYRTKTGKLVTIPYALVRCSCGFERESRLYDITKGRSKMCRPCRGRIRGVKPYSGSSNGRWVGHGEIPGRLYRQFATGAKTRGIPFDISLEYIADLWERQEGRCALSGERMSIPKSKTKGTPLEERARFASLDRIDSSKGYVEGNVWWVCAAVNLMKQDYPLELFLDLVDKIHNHNKKEKQDE